MKQITYLKKALKKLLKNFPQIGIRYEYNKEYNLHCVEIIPEHEFYNNNELAKKQLEILNDFESNFPKDELVFFTSDDDFLKINNPILELTTKGYDYIEENINLEIDKTFKTTTAIKNFTNIDSMLENTLEQDNNFFKAA